VDVNVTALLDSGSTHNFISAWAATSYDLCFIPRTDITVTGANCDRVPASGVFRSANFIIRSEHLQLTSSSFPSAAMIWFWALIGWPHSDQFYGISAAICCPSGVMVVGFVGLVLPARVDLISTPTQWRSHGSSSTYCW
jgi:hypothetical protein